MKYHLLIPAIYRSFTLWTAITLLIVHQLTSISSVLYQSAWILAVLAGSGGLIISSNKIFIDKISYHIDSSRSVATFLFVLSHVLILIFCFFNRPIFKNRSIITLMAYVVVFIVIYIGVVGIKNIGSVYHGIPIDQLISILMVVFVIIMYIIHRNR